MESTLLHLEKAIVTGIYTMLKNQVVVSVELHDEVISGSKYENVVFENVVFKNCHLQASHFKGVHFIDCKFINCDFSFTELEACNWVACTIENCKFCITNSLNNNFLSCTYLNNDWQKCIDTNLSIANCNLDQSALQQLSKQISVDNYGDISCFHETPLLRVVA